MNIAMGAEALQMKVTPLVIATVGISSLFGIVSAFIGIVLGCGWIVYLIRTERRAAQKAREDTDSHRLGKEVLEEKLRILRNTKDVDTV